MLWKNTVWTESGSMMSMLIIRLPNSTSYSEIITKLR